MEHASFGDSCWTRDIMHACIILVSFIFQLIVTYFVHDGVPIGEPSWWPPSKVNAIRIVISLSKWCKMIVVATVDEGVSKYKHGRHQLLLPATGCICFKEQTSREEEQQREKDMVAEGGHEDGVGGIEKKKVHGVWYRIRDGKLADGKLVNVLCCLQLLPTRSKWAACNEHLVAPFELLALHCMHERKRKLA